MDWLDRENRKNDAPGTWLFGWFLLFVAIWGFKEHPVGTAILVTIAAVWYIRRLNKQLEEEEQSAPADQGT